MTKPDIESLSREFCELAGICWHDYIWIDALNYYPNHPLPGFYKCKFCFHIADKDIMKNENSDFTVATEILKVMKGRPDYYLFLRWLYVDAATPEEILDRSLVQRVLDTTGLLLKEAVEFLKLKGER